MSESVILTAVSGAVVTVTLNRPDKRNALNVELLDGLSEAIARAERETSNRVLILRGSGPVFCAGLDLTEAAQPGRAEASAQRVEVALRALATTRLMTVAAVQGAAIAGGAGLMNACDFALATADAKFGYPEVRRGLVPALIMTFLRRQLRERDARELLLLGKPIDAPRALAIGLINRIAENAAALETEVQAVVSSSLQGGPETLATTKRLLNDLWPATWDRDFAAAHAIHLAARTSTEAAEGIAAFHEKRAPKWAP